MDNNEQNKIVQDYIFADAAQADLARSEIKKINYIEERLNYNNTKMVYNFYHNCIENKVFSTPIGYAFLKKLRDQIIHNGFEGEVQQIPVATNNHLAIREVQKEKIEEGKLRSIQEKLRFQFRMSLIINLILVLLVIGMFYIARSSSNPNIINYENALVNKYAAWEEELSARENSVREKELEYSIENP